MDVVICQDGEEALQLYENSTADAAFDAIILDILMPGMNGEECARELRDRGYSGPLLAVTGRCRNESESIEEGLFDEWVTKPLDRNQFVCTLRELVAPETVSPVS